MTLEIPYHLSDEVRRLVDHHGYTPEAAVAKAARASVELHKAPQRTEQVQPASCATDDDPDALRATQRRRTPRRDPVPESTGISPLNERQFQGMVEYLFRSEGWLVFHPYDSRRSEPGFPDVYAVHPDRGVVQAELKMPNGRISEAQQKWLDTIQAAGYRAYLWYPDDWHDIEAIAQGKQS